MPNPLTPAAGARTTRGRLSGTLPSLALGAWAALAGGCQTAQTGTAPAGAVTRSARAQQSGDKAGGDKPAPDDGAGVAGTTSVWDRFNLFKLPPSPPPPVETAVFRGDGLAEEPPPKEGSPEAKLAGARELFRRGDYSAACRLFARLAEDTKKTPLPVAAEARFYEAECYRLEGRYPKAADIYADVLNGEKYPGNAFREQSMQHMYDIANFWLDPTREEMKESQEKKDGKRWVVWPHFLSFDKERPVLDGEGRALEKLEQVRWGDVNGPLADRALFLTGAVKFFNEDYREADHCFSQIHERHPNSPYAEQAIELALVAKQMATGGAEYDGRRVAEARKLVQAAFENYPKLAGEKKDFLARQLYGITLQQAEKDFKMAEFWRRTGHPGSAYFYFELVRRRYPNTKYAELAVEKMGELRSKAEKEQASLPTPPAEAAGTPPSGARPEGPKVEVGPVPRTLPRSGGAAGPAPGQLPQGFDNPPPPSVPPTPGR